MSEPNVKLNNFKRKDLHERGLINIYVLIQVDARDIGYLVESFYR